MPIDQNSYQHRGGGRYGVVIHCPPLVPNRLIYLVVNQGTWGWVVRDFIGGRQLGSEHLDEVRSRAALVAIEMATTFHENPPPPNVEPQNWPEWRSHLSMRSAEVPAVREIPTDAPTEIPGAEADKWVDLH